jgi:hypothetical protein
VHATHLRCRWKDWKKVERDEAREITFLDYMADQPEQDRALAEAATAVLLSSGEDLLLDDYRNYSRQYSEQVAGMERVADRIGMTDRPWRSWPCFTNHDGDIYIPNTLLVDLAIAFAKAEPETVHLYLDVEERQLLDEGYHHWEHRTHRELLQMKPAYALARHWAGGVREHKYLQERVRELYLLVEYTITALEECGSKRKANYARKRLEDKRDNALDTLLKLD